MRTCFMCGIDFVPKPSSKGKFCGTACMGRWNTKKVIDAWKSGDDPGWTGVTVQLKIAVRRYVLEKANFACSVCGWAERHPVDDHPLVEVDHINGDPYDCSEGNLQVLCPNHHAMTPTHRARNKGNGRKR